MKSNKSGYVYLIQCREACKIGFSKDVERRLKQLDKMPFEMEIIAKVYLENAYDVEQRIHHLFRDFRINGEWFILGCFLNEMDFHNLVYKVKEAYNL